MMEMEADKVLFSHADAGAPGDDWAGFRSPNQQLKAESWSLGRDGQLRAADNRVILVRVREGLPKIRFLIAQLVEHPPVKRLVVGSSPTQGANSWIGS